MNSFEKKILKEILSTISANNLTAAQDDIESYTQGLQIEVYSKGRQKAHLNIGKTYKYYDLASLTKILFTVPAFMQLHDEGRLRLNDKISQSLAWWPHKKTEIGHVLSHSAGLEWWAPFYKKINHKLPYDIKREAVRKYLSKEKLHSSKDRAKKSVYSDLDFILLGFALESYFAKPLIDIWQSELNFAGHNYNEQLKSLHFCIGNKPKYKRSLYAPTEKCPWRKKVLQGEVHDDNTWAFGGISTHAGLFGSIEDVSHYGLMLRRSLYNLAGAKLSSPTTAKKFCKRAIPATRGDWASGFMLPTKGGASCGRYFSKTSVGHTGFTGTSLWFDPDRDLLVSILSNRVHPTRDNRNFIKLRPQLHDIIVQSL